MSLTNTCFFVTGTSGLGSSSRSATSFEQLRSEHRLLRPSVVNPPGSSGQSQPQTINQQPATHRTDDTLGQGEAGAEQQREQHSSGIPRAVCESRRNIEDVRAEQRMMLLSGVVPPSLSNQINPDFTLPGRGEPARRAGQAALDRFNRGRMWRLHPYRPESRIRRIEFSGPETHSLPVGTATICNDINGVRNYWSQESVRAREFAELQRHRIDIFGEEPPTQSQISHYRMVVAFHGSSRGRPNLEDMLATIPSTYNPSRARRNITRASAAVAVAGRNGVRSTSATAPAQPVQRTRRTQAGATSLRSLPPVPYNLSPVPSPVPSDVPSLESFE